MLQVRVAILSLLTLTPTKLSPPIPKIESPLVRVIDKNVPVDMPESLQHKFQTQQRAVKQS